jgi:hypothetical protein
VRRNNIPIYIQQDATLHSLFISGNCSTCFGWYHHPSSGAQKSVYAASGIYHTVTAIFRFCGRVGTGLSVLWVEYTTLSTLRPVTNLAETKIYETEKPNFKSNTYFSITIL